MVSEHAKNGKTDNAQLYPNRFLVDEHASRGHLTETKPGANGVRVGEGKALLWAHVRVEQSRIVLRSKRGSMHNHRVGR